MDKFKKLFVGLGTVAVLSTATEKLAAQDKDSLIIPQTTGVTKIETAQNQNLDSLIEFIGSQQHLEDIYNKNKDVNDQGFGGNDIVELPDGVTLGTNYSLNSISIVVMKRNANGEMISREEFESFEALMKAYPGIANEDSVKKHVSEEYEKYIKKVGWKKVLDEKRSTLSNNFEDYKPTQSELDVLKEALAKRNGGGTSDGFDEILHFYIDAFKSPEDEYRFYVKHNGTPSHLATYMTDKYYRPFVK